MYPIEKMCKAFKVSRSGYYGWLNSEPPKRALENQEILQEIKLTYQQVRWDNAVAESFFKILKVECVYNYKFSDQRQAATIVFEYIEIWYSRKRLHSFLGYRTSAQMEQLLNQPALIA